MDWLKLGWSVYLVLETAGVFLHNVVLGITLDKGERVVRFTPSDEFIGVIVQLGRFALLVGIGHHLGWI